MRELDVTSADAERALIRAGELEARLEAMERADARQRGELAGLRLRLADREEAVTALLARAPAAAAADPGAIDGLRAQLAAARAEADQLRARVAALDRPAGVEAPPVEAPAPDLRAALAARDALVARLQAELAASVDRQRALGRELDEASRAVAEERERAHAAQAAGAVGAEESVRELEELTERLEASEAERRQALETLEEARAILRELSRGLPEGPDDGGGVSPDARALRERLARLEAQAADREVLLRSLTAQLQERDDRIRALERFDPADDEDPNALKAALLELRERAARLTEELANERDARRLGDR
ncbi:MAG: hypothetical protein KF729_17360 [Sandaracinaceae bacterium]|nr:hypothetical protein [Sandaracinaceae bacterium]